MHTNLFFLTWIALSRVCIDRYLIVGLKAILEANPDIKAQVVVFGTPAEEGGGGKVLMINKGCFDDMDICMMSHPAPFDSVVFPCLAVCTLKIVYHGEL